MINFRSPDDSAFGKNVLQRGIVRATYIVHNIANDTAITRNFVEGLILEGFGKEPIVDLETDLNRLTNMTHCALLDLPGRHHMPTRADIDDAIHQRKGLAAVLNPGAKHKNRPTMPHQFD